MSRVAYVNGAYRPMAEAAVSIDDRGFLFADGVYEVVSIRHGRFLDLDPHLDRLDRSLAELAIAPAMSRGALGAVLSEVVRRNRVREGMVYLQVTRGVARRDHAFPARSQASVIAWARRIAPVPPALRERGVAVISTPDLRWRRCDIKSISLLPNVLAKQMAREMGAFEAWLVDSEGLVTEGSSTNAWIVDDAGHLITRSLGPAILAGVTRQVVRTLADLGGIEVVERPFSLEEAKAASEAFLTSTTSGVMPVVRVDGVPVGKGSPGPVTRLLMDRYDTRPPG